MKGAGSIARLPGFRDFGPDALAVRTQIFDAWRTVALRYGFHEFEGPPLEPLGLYVQKSGDEIVSQLYAFEDKGGRDVALRPEATPTLARMLAERSRAMPKPIRWFTIPQLFRYERQQKGRLREHFQWNVDIVGEAGPAADAEVLAVAIDGLRELGLDATDVAARVSDRRLFVALLDAVQVPAGSHATVFAVVDKLERAGAEWAAERLRDDADLSPEQVSGLLDTLTEPGLEAVRRRFGEVPAIAERLAGLDAFHAHLEGLGLGDYVLYDLRIVRGLAYYTGIVFELFDRQGQMRAICGGGRYDGLLELVGGEPLAAVGFGMGDVVLSDLLAARGLARDWSPFVDLFIVTTGLEQRPLALEIASVQRARGKSVLYPLALQSVRKQLKSAATAGAQRALILGPEEVRRGVAVVRDMAGGEETEVKLEELRR